MRRRRYPLTSLLSPAIPSLRSRFLGASDPSAIAKSPCCLKASMRTTNTHNSSPMPKRLRQRELAGQATPLGCSCGLLKMVVLSKCAQRYVLAFSGGVCRWQCRGQGSILEKDIVKARLLQAARKPCSSSFHFVRLSPALNWRAADS